MSYAGYKSMAVGVGAVAGANDAAQLIVGFSVIKAVETMFGLQQNEQKIQAKDAHDAFVNTISPTNQTNPVPALLSQQTKELHSAQADAELNIMNTIISGQKSQNEVLGENPGQLFLLMEPVFEFLRSVTRSLKVI